MTAKTGAGQAYAYKQLVDNLYNLRTQAVGFTWPRHAPQDVERVIERAQNGENITFASLEKIQSFLGLPIPLLLSKGMIDACRFCLKRAALRRVMKTAVEQGGNKAYLENFCANARTAKKERGLRLCDIVNESLVQIGDDDKAIQRYETMSDILTGKTKNPKLRSLFSIYTALHSIGDSDMGYWFCHPSLLEAWKAELAKKSKRAGGGAPNPYNIHSLLIQPPYSPDKQK
ncbi:MAG: hypothetical protein SOZ01_01910 [Selenomonadaceae bacterium]|nr:hypothetical protein [Selenomonadaceae bacterium]